MKKLAIFSVLICAAAQAAKVGPDVPAFVTANEDGTAFVYFLKSKRTGTTPSCATFAATTGSYFRYAINTNTAGGKAQLAVILSANAAGKEGWAAGTGVCNVVNDTETLQEFHTNG